MKKMLVDEKCRELAYYFLQSFATADQCDAQELAERIQATVEEFCDVAFNVPAPPPDPRDPDYYADDNTNTAHSECTIEFERSRYRRTFVGDSGTRWGEPWEAEGTFEEVKA